LGSKRLIHQRSNRNRPNSHNTQVISRIAPILFSLFALVAALYPAKACAQSISVIQRATLNQQPSSSGTITLTLPKATGAGHAFIVGVSFWPLDISSVTDNSGDAFTRGLTTSIYHNVSQGVMYTNFYYAKNTAGGATSITLNFSHGSTYVVAAVSEVAGLDPAAPLDQSGYHESLSSASPWSSAGLATTAPNEYLFAWAADEWSNPSCSNATSGWTQTQNTSGATLCLLDRAVSTTGSYQVSVTPSAAFNYAMEIVGFKGASSSLSPAPAPFAGAGTTGDLNHNAACGNGRHGIFGNAFRYRRSFAVHVVCQRSPERSCHEQHRHDKRRSNYRRYANGLFDGKRLHRHDRINVALSNHQQLWAASQAGDYPQPFAFWQRGIRWG
jgi:hypothetical protein